MREIKFRGRRIDNGKWVYGYLIGKNVIVGEIVEFSDEYFNTEFWYKVDPETIGLSTGMRDRNGTEIFEGDVIRERDKWGDYHDYVVKWSKESLAFLFESSTEECRIYEINIDFCEVIGNIHDNPELLKGDENE